MYMRHCHSKSLFFSIFQLGLQDFNCKLEDVHRGLTWQAAFCLLLLGLIL